MKPNKKIIGITGTIAAGKSTASKYLAEKYGIPLVDADLVGHEVLQDPEVMQQLAETISPLILVDGKIDRKILGGIVFQDPQKLQQLNAITHPVITKRIHKQVQDFLEGENEASFMLIEAYGLMQSDLIHMVEEIWVVCAERELRIERVMKRQGLSREEAVRRVDNQWSDEEYRKRADIALDGSRDTEYMKEQCDRIMEIYRN